MLSLLRARRCERPAGPLTRRRTAADTGTPAISYLYNFLHERAQPVAEPEPAAAHALRLRDEHLVDQAVLDGLVGAEVEVARPA